MTVAVLVPWSPGCPWRERAWAWARARWGEVHPDWEVVTGRSDFGTPFSRAQGILHAASRTDADVLVVADADVWCDPAPAVNQVAEHGWAIPHRLIHRLSLDSTLQVYGGTDWRGLPLSTDNHQDSRPYRGHPTGTLVVLTRDALEAAPPDPRFVGWGQEDDAWACALKTMVGKPWRGDDDLVHLWHPPQARQSRAVGSPEGLALLRRYRAARGNQDRMRALIAEHVQVPA